MDGTVTIFIQRNIAWKEKAHNSPLLMPHAAVHSATSREESGCQLTWLYQHGPHCFPSCSRAAQKLCHCNSEGEGVKFKPARSHSLINQWFVIRRSCWVNRCLYALISAKMKQHVADGWMVKEPVCSCCASDTGSTSANNISNSWLWD